MKSRIAALALVLALGVAGLSAARGDAPIAEGRLIYVTYGNDQTLSGDGSDRFKVSMYEKYAIVEDKVEKETWYVPNESLKIAKFKQP